MGTDRQCEVEVRVLGPVEVVGASRPFCRAGSFDLVVYLAFHRQGVTTDRWATALWPDRAMAPATLHSTVSCARRSLGRSAGGLDHLPRGRGWLRLAGSVGSDWDRFSALSEEGEEERKEGRAIESWWRALDLLRGRPFEGLRSSDWTVLEGIAAEVEEVVVRLALRIGDHCLGGGDGAGAGRAARRGLVVSPYDERLYRMLLRAADLEGNPAGVEGAMADLTNLLGADGGAERPGGPVRRNNLLAGGCRLRMDQVHPETAALYRSLSRRAWPVPTDTREASARL